jgi:hypothetical protein
METTPTLVTGSDAPADSFPVADCPRCAKTVLTHLWFDDSGTELRCCVHCDTAVDPVRWVGEADLAGVGYAAADGLAGCGRPDCGRGRCGTGPR